jgi:mannose-6-phosphate isomerase-like protein (cupin superfamily)
VGEMHSGNRPSVVGPAQGRRLLISGKPSVLLESLTTAGSLCIFEQRVGPYLLGVPHTHTHEDQVVYVIEGEIGHRIGDEDLVAAAGSVVFKPRGVSHAVFNRTAKPARMLEISVPGRIMEYFDAVDALVRSAEGPSQPVVNQLAQQYGLSFEYDLISEIEKQHGVLWPGHKGSAAPKSGDDS